MEPLNRYLFIDIETASCVADHDQLSPGMQREWQKKAKTKFGEEADPELLFSERSGIFSEFGKVVCISVGCFREKEGRQVLYLRSFYGDDEKDILSRFCASLDKFSRGGRKPVFVGHNIKEFDLPYISRRMIINGMVLPDCLMMQGKKPWEVPHIDTMQIWAFGDYKSYTRLSLLAEVLGIPTPKDDISGEDVNRVYWQEQNLDRIAIYCQKDVETTTRVFMRLMCYEEFDFSVEIIPEQVAVAV